MDRSFSVFLTALPLCREDRDFPFPFLVTVSSSPLDSSVLHSHSSSLLGGGVREEEEGGLEEEGKGGRSGWGLLPSRRHSR